MYTEQEIKLSASLTSNLKSLAKAHQVTLNNMVQGAWALLLGRYSGETDVVFGATRACRRSAIAGAESIVGPLINTLPMRLHVAEDMQLMDWLKQIRAKHIALREYEHDPLMKIQEWSEVSNGRSLFDSILVFENYELDTFLRAQGESWGASRVQTFRADKLSSCAFSMGRAGTSFEACLRSAEFRRRRYQKNAWAREDFIGRDGSKSISTSCFASYVNRRRAAANAL